MPFVTRIIKLLTIFKVIKSIKCLINKILDYYIITKTF